MKIRSGFVSNSSSSSFIVSLNFKSKDELRKILFGSDEVYTNPYVWDDESIKDWPIEDVVDIVYNDLMDGKIGVEEVLNEYCRGYTEVTDQVDQEIPYNYSQSESYEERRQRYDKIKERTRELSSKVVDQFIKENPGDLYEVSYSDDSTLGSALEHGSLWNRFPHLRISHH